ITLAVYFWPEVTMVADTLVASSITWLLVSTRPLAEITMPVPSAVASLYVRAEVTSTMPGSTLLASAAAFSEPVPAFVLPDPSPLLEGTGMGAVFPLPPRGLDADPFPLNGELAVGLAEEPEWFSPTAAP